MRGCSSVGGCQSTSRLQGEDTPLCRCSALGRVDLELVNLSGNALTRDAVRRLRFVFHAAAWLHSMVPDGHIRFVVVAGAYQLYRDFITPLYQMCCCSVVVMSSFLNMALSRFNIGSIVSYRGISTFFRCLLKVFHGFITEHSWILSR